MPAFPSKRASVITDVLGDREFDRQAHPKDFLAEACLEHIKESEKEEREQLAAGAVEKRPLLALVAHDNMKKLMATFATEYREQLAAFRLTGTGTTCKMLQSIGLTPEDHGCPSGPLGGDQVLGGMIAKGEIKAIFFFRDPLTAHPHGPDIDALIRISDVYQVYCATNYRTAAAVVTKLHKDFKAVQKSQGQKVRSSVLTPEGMEDLSAVVQSDYKATRAAAVAKAVDGQEAAGAGAELARAALEAVRCTPDAGGLGALPEAAEEEESDEDDDGEGEEWMAGQEGVMESDMSKRGILKHGELVQRSRSEKLAYEAEGGLEGRSVEGLFAVAE